ncbi:MAG: hypothetical protein ACTHKP_15365 [Nitrososphaeraceae archaeon]
MDKVIPLSVVVIAAPANVYDTRIAAIVTLGNIIVDGPSHKMFKRNKTAVLIKDMFQEIEVRKLIEDIYYTFEIEENNQLQRLMVVVIIVIMLKEDGL